MPPDRESIGEPLTDDAQIRATIAGRGSSTKIRRERLLLPSLHLDYTSTNREMDEKTRALLAAIVSALHNGQRPAQVFDYAGGRNYALSAEELDRIVVRESHVRANARATYDERLTVRIIDGDFSGVDRSSGASFFGTVHGRTVLLYDSDEGRYFTFPR